MLHVDGTRVHYELSRKYYLANLFAKHAQNVKTEKSESNNYQRNLSKLKRTTFRCHDKHMALTSMGTQMEKYW